MEKELEMLTGYARNQTADVKKRAEQTGTITFIASTKSVDRHGTILNQEGWKLENFRRNPIIGYQHEVYGGGMCNGADPDDVIGRGQNVQIVNGELILDIVFDRENPKAEKIFKKIQNGFLNAVSVGFIPIPDENGQESRMGDEMRGENPDAEYMFGQELLEVSVVNIPSNPDAVKKGFDMEKERIFKGLKRATGLDIDSIEKLTIKDAIEAITKRNFTREVTPVEETKVEVTPEEVEENETKAKAEVSENAEVEKTDEVSKDAVPTLSIEEARNITNKQKTDNYAREYKSC